MQNNDNKFVNRSRHTTSYSRGIHIVFHYLKLSWISCNNGTAGGSSEGSDYCIDNVRSKATHCFAIWCECFHHSASCPSSERYWKGYRPSVSLVCELVDLTLDFLSLVHIACVVWLCWRHMVPDNFQWGNGDGPFSQTSRGALFLVRTVDVVYTDVLGNASPTLAFLRGIGLLWWFDYGLGTGISQVKVAVDCDNG